MLLDYSHKNLTGRSFKGKNLVGANFSFADIRSCDFSEAILKDANFYHAKAGRQNLWVIYLPVCSLLFLGILGFFSYIANYLVTLIAQSSNLDNLITGVSTSILLVIFFLTTFCQRLETGVPLFIVIGTITVLFLTGIKSTAAFNGASAGVLIIAITLVGSIALSAAIAAFNRTVAVMISILVMLCLTAAVTASFLKLTSSIDSAFLVFLPVVVAIAIALVSLYMSYQAIEGNKKYNFIRNTAVAIASKGSTNFHKADLTNTSFRKAQLRNADLRNATLINTDFYQSQMLDYAQLEKTYLQNAQVRDLLVTKQGQDITFDRQDLRGVKLKDANLEYASFIGADLSHANLQDANLSGAKLVQTQLDGTDFTGATLTGAFIKDWNITTDTKFDEVRCKYVYMRLPTPDNLNQHRKPDNHQEVFALGEFEDFIKPIFDTLDLYHNQGVDPRAIAISFKQLAENNPEADLRIVGMEVRGEDKLLLRAKTAITADKSQLNAEYFATYNQLKALAEQEVKALIAEKDGRIADLQNMVVTALQRPSFYSNVEQVGFMTNNPGGFSVGGSVGGNVNNVQGDNNRAVQGDNNQAVLGDGNQVTQHNQTGADTGESLTKEDVVKLLAELENLIQRAELPTDIKQEVVEDLSAAKKATDKEEPNKQPGLARLKTY